MLNAMLAKAQGTQQEYIFLGAKVKDGFLEKMTFKLIIIDQMELSSKEGRGRGNVRL